MNSNMVLTPSQNIVLYSPLFSVHIRINNNEYKHIYANYIYRLIDEYMFSLKRIYFGAEGVLQREYEN